MKDNNTMSPCDQILSILPGITKKMNPNTARAYYRHINAFAEYIDHARIMSFNGITDDTVNGFLVDCSNRPNTYNQALSAVLFILDFCDANISEVENYTRIKSRLKQKRLPAASVQKLTLSRYKLLAARDNAYGLYSDRSLLIRNLLIFDVAMHTMMRCDELVQIHLGDIDMNEKRLYVRGKGGASDSDGNRSVTGSIQLTQKLTDQIGEYINQWRFKCYSETRKPNYKIPGTINPDSPLFVSQKKKGISASAINKIASEIISSIYQGNDGYDPNKVPRNHAIHCIRRSMATARLNTGEKIENIQMMLRHANIQTTMRYLDITQKTIDECFTKEFP